MNNVSMRALSAAVILAVSTVAISAEDPMDEVIITAQKTQEGSIGGWLPTPLPELPRTVMIVDEEVLQRQFVSTTKDIIKNVPGVQILPDNNLAGYQTPIIRGIGATQYFEGQYSAGIATSIPEAIGGAEVLQGFNSLQFAVDTGGGSVNYFLKRPTGENFLQTELQGNNWGGAKLVLDGNYHVGPGDTDGVRFVAVADRDQSYVRDFPRREGNKGVFMWRYSGLAGIQMDLDLSAWDIKNDPNNKFIPVGTVPTVPIPELDPRTNYAQSWSEHAERKGHQIGFKMSKEFGEWRALAAVAYDRTTYYNNACNINNPNFVTGEASYDCRESTFGPLWDKQIRFDLTGKARFLGLDHYMAMGFRQSGQDWKQLTTSHVFDDPMYLTQNIFEPRTYPKPTSFTEAPNKYRSTFDDKVYYFQDKISAGSKVDIWAGVGYVENDGSHGPTMVENQLPLTHVVVPSGGIVFKANSSSNYYVSYAEGVSRADVVGTSDPTIVNPGTLIPAVHSKSYEVGGKWTLAERMQLNVAVFKMTQPFVINELVQEIPPRYKRYSGGLSEYTGFSLDFRGKLTHSIELQGGFTSVDPVQKTTEDESLEGNKTAGVARQSGVLNVIWDAGDVGGLSVDGGVYYQSNMFLNPQNTYRLDGFTRVDLGATYDTAWSDNDVRLRLLLENALDDKFYYGFSGGFQLAAPRTLRASVVVRF
ncbi:MAG: TonB-dependent receptor [Pseudomonadota bacterium]